MLRARSAEVFISLAGGLVTSRILASLVANLFEVCVASQFSFCTFYS